jgi:transcriptional regulator with XRE-family HTH domain
VSSERPSIEAAFAENLKALRATRSMTQADLADKMHMRGFKWHPATVYKIENGERQIQLAEAVEVARVLEISIEDMTQESQQLSQQLRDLRSGYLSVRDTILLLADHLAAYPGQTEHFATLFNAADEARALLPPDELERMTRAAHPGDELLEPIRKAHEAIGAMLEAML